MDDKQAERGNNVIIYNRHHKKQREKGATLRETCMSPQERERT